MALISYALTPTASFSSLPASMTTVSLPASSACSEALDAGTIPRMVVILMAKQLDLVGVGRRVPR